MAYNSSAVLSEAKTTFASKITPVRGKNPQTQLLAKSQDQSDLPSQTSSISDHCFATVPGLTGGSQCQSHATIGMLL